MIGGGTWERAHARHEATGVRQPVRRRGDDVAGGGASAAAGDAGGRVLSGISAGERPHLVDSFRRGLSEAGYLAGQNVAIEYRYAENRPDPLGR